MKLRHTRSAVWPALREERFATRIQTASAEGCRLALLGLPDDLGVKLNHGRPGAGRGPEAFRKALARFGGHYDATAGRSLDLRIYDAGDVEPAPGDDEAALYSTHSRVEDSVLELQRQGLVTVCVGGGHDLSLPGIAALSRHLNRELGGVNLDAHLDVRTSVGSGMPFRRLLENKHVAAARFVELGLGRFSNSGSDTAWLTSSGARLVYAAELRRPDFSLASLLEPIFEGGAAFVSIDLDALDQSLAPGVSAPNPHGVELGLALELAERAGAEPNVRHFDLMELNPDHDPLQTTARVAALLFIHFVAGFQQRISA